MEHAEVMKRIETDVIEGRTFFYLNLSEMQDIDDLHDIIAAVKPIMSKFAEKSVHMISNVKNSRFDSEVKKVLGELIVFNTPYVRFSAIIGANGVQKVMGNAMFKLKGRSNAKFLYTKEQAVEWMLRG
jgi:hypothetical protein